MRISDWSSDVCSSDLEGGADRRGIVRLLRPGLGAGAEQRGQPAARFHRLDGDVAGRQLRGMLRPFLEIVPDRESAAALDLAVQIGSASCRERVCQYV